MKRFTLSLSITISWSLNGFYQSKSVKKLHCCFSRLKPNATNALHKPLLSVVQRLAVISSVMEQGISVAFLLRVSSMGRRGRGCSSLIDQCLMYPAAAWNGRRRMTVFRAKSQSCSAQHGHGRLNALFGYLAHTGQRFSESTAPAPQPATLMIPQTPAADPSSPGHSLEQQEKERETK